VPTALGELFMLPALNFPTYINPVNWSLYVEVCFYVSLPIFVLATGRRVYWACAAAFVDLLFADAPGPRSLHLWKFFFAGILASGLADLLSGWTRRFGREAVGVALGATLVYLDFHEFDWCNKLRPTPPSGAGWTVGLACGFGLVLAGALG
jgi:hypothetical protein